MLFINYSLHLQIFDEAGNDVTPLPLHSSDPNQVKQKQSNLLADSSGGTVSSILNLMCDWHYNSLPFQ